MMNNLWRNYIAKWIAMRLPYSVVCWCGVRMLKYANIHRFSKMSWAQVMDIWESQEGK